MLSMLKKLILVSSLLVGITALLISCSKDDDKTNGETSPVVPPSTEVSKYFSADSLSEAITNKDGEVQVAQANRFLSPASAELGDGTDATFENQNMAACEYLEFSGQSLADTAQRSGDHITCQINQEIAFVEQLLKAKNIDRKAIAAGDSTEVTGTVADLMAIFPADADAPAPAEATGGFALLIDHTDSLKGKLGFSYSIKDASRAQTRDGDFEYYIGDSTPADGTVIGRVKFVSKDDIKKSDTVTDTYITELKGIYKQGDGFTYSVTDWTKEMHAQMFLDYDSSTGAFKGSLVGKPVKDDGSTNDASSPIFKSVFGGNIKNHLAMEQYPGADPFTPDVKVYCQDFTTEASSGTTTKCEERAGGQGFQTLEDDAKIVSEYNIPDAAPSHTPRYKDDGSLDLSNVADDLPDPDQLPHEYGFIGGVSFLQAPVPPANPQANPQQGEPQQGEPQQGEPQQGEPQQGEPQQGEPQQGEPQTPPSSDASGDASGSPGP